MSDVLVKGMEMPKSCSDDSPKPCPLVELPDNHGRIVDLDRVLDWLANDKRCFSMAMTSKIEKALSDAPVILEASK